ncbi:ATP-dependent helicase [Nocardia terpenica]
MSLLTAQQRRFLSVPLMESGWQLLIDSANVPTDRAAAFAIGRTGVYALVFTDTVPDSSRLHRIRRHAEETFGGVLGGRSRFVPHMLEVVLLMSSAVRTEAHDPFLTADESTLRATLLGGEGKLSPSWTRELATSATARAGQYRRISSDDAPKAETPAAEGLFGATELREDERGRILTRPFQEWMTFLDPEQIALVNTNFTGPARFSGPAGTGKTVVALHRMARFAKSNPGRLLFTSFVKTLPSYHESGFAHLAPRAVDRAEFIGLHAWTTRFLARRHIAHKLPGDNEYPYKDAFARAWSKARNELGQVKDTDLAYWQDEVDRVIKGRGIATLEEYRTITRSGRDRIQLSPDRRTVVWEQFYEPYRHRLKERGFDDFNDLIVKAIDELRARPLDDTEDYALVVVDEVQDFTLMQLKLVYQIAGGTPNAQLLMVGDGQQQVYAGGWTLSQAGIPLPGGRGRVLRTNYRNREAVLRYAQRIEASDTVDDLDGGPGFALRDSDGVLPGGRVIEKLVPRADIDAELVRAVTESDLAASENADIAVLVNGRNEARHYLQVLQRAGFDVLPLENYNGSQHGAIKVGTVHRAKGMDFAAVFRIITQADTESATTAGGARDRSELLARQHLVASSRARDYLWVAIVKADSKP